MPELELVQAPDNQELLRPSVDAETAFAKVVEAKWCKWDGSQLKLNKDVTLEQWQIIGNILKGKTKSIQFMVGDWVNFGENRYGEKYAQGLSDTDWDYGTLRNFAYVAARIAPQDRHPDVDYSKHKIVARLPPNKQREYLTLCSTEKLTVNQLEKKVREKYPYEDRVRKDRRITFSDWVESYAKELDCVFPERMIEHLENAWDAAIQKGRHK